jgi:SAM-dependent methyltransferase
MQIINPSRFQALIEAARSAAFSGWDFTWLSGRMLEDDPPWDYEALVLAHLGGITSLLDMGTGGGEFLASLPILPLETHATESYPPNQGIAWSSLAPLGVQVHLTTEGAPLPFTSGFFDRVINRHESYNPAEVYRLLKPGGVFITQQVGGLDNLEINQALEDGVSFPFTGWSLYGAATDLEGAGFTVERADGAALKTQFTDIGALVYYLKAVPWQVEDFDVERYQEQLIRLHNFIEAHGAFVTTAHRFLIIARKEV